MWFIRFVEVPWICKNRYLAKEPPDLTSYDQAFNAGENALKPVEDFLDSTLQLEVDSEAMNEAAEEVKVTSPSTPQLKQGLRLLDDGDCQDHTNSSTEKECGGQEGDSKSVETTFALTEVIQPVEHHLSTSEAAVKEEDDSVNVLKSASNISSHLQNTGDENRIKASSLPHSKATRKKSKVFG